MNEQLKIAEGAKEILNTVKDELFPVSNKLKDLLINIQGCRIKFLLYSKKFNKLESEYAEVSKEFFTIVRKLETPDILFKDLVKSSQHIVDYFQFKGAFSQSIEDGTKYVEIIDRTLDRKSQSIQNFRTFLLAVVAIIVSLFW